MLPKLKRILHYTDLSDQACMTFRHVLGIAQTCKASITLLHTFEIKNENDKLMGKHYPLISPQSQNDNNKDKNIAQLRNELQQRLERFYAKELKNASEARDGFEIELVVQEGPPAQTILSQAKYYKSDIIILGTYGYSAFHDTSIGSIAHKVAQISPNPVLIVPVR